MFVTIEQCKKIIEHYLSNSGRGGFMTGVVNSVSPLSISVGQRLVLDSDNAYITDSCIGLRINGVEVRPALKAGDGVLILCRPGGAGGTNYIILDRIQPYVKEREVSV